MATPYFQNNFRGGMSNDDFLGPEGSFRDAQNVDVRTRPSGAQLSALKTDIATLAGNGVKLLKAGNTIYAFTDTGKVHDALTGWQVYVTPDGASYLNATVFRMADGKDWLYMFKGSKKIDRVEVQTNGNIVWSGVVVDWADFNSTTDASTRIDLAQANDAQFYIAYGRTVYYMDKGFAGGSLTTSNIALVVRAGEKIVGVTYYWDFFKVYTDVGRVYQWDGVDTVPYYVFSFPGTFFRYVLNAGKQDYCVSGSSTLFSQLFLQSGYDLVPVNRSYEFTATGKFQYALGSTSSPVAFNNNVTYFADGVGIYSMGEYVPGIKTGINREILLSASGDAVVYSMLAYNDTLYFCYTLGGVSKTASVNLGAGKTYAASGQIDSLVLKSDKMWKRKKIDEIEISYEIPSTNTNSKIDFYLNVDKQGWTLIWTASDKAKFFTRFPVAKIVKSEWSVLQWRAVITRDTTLSTTTPVLYETNILYSDIQWGIEK